MQKTSKLREFEPETVLCDPGNSEIGSGSHGDVVLGHHESFNALAIKIFKMCGGKKDKQLITRRFFKEIEHLQEANHENIVRVFGHVKWPYALGIVMEYCPAGNLRQFILDPDIPVGISLSIRMLTDVASAIAFIHNLFDDKRLIHLDIKPENILLTVELRCKVGDLGSAEVITLSGLTTTTAIGSKGIPAITPQYTPPERLRDMSILPSKEHDTYGYGIVTYVVFARAPPYPNGELAAILDSIKNGTRPNLSLMQGRLGNLNDRDRAMLEKVITLMKKCWDQNPQKRPKMMDVKSSMSKLLHQQNRSLVRHQVESALQKMEINDSILQNQDQLVPLHCFSTRTGHFEKTEERPAHSLVADTTAGSALKQEISEIKSRREFAEPALRKRKQENVKQNPQAPRRAKSSQVSRRLKNLAAPTRPKPASSTTRNCGRQAVVVSILAFCLIGMLFWTLSKSQGPIINKRFESAHVIAGVFGGNEEVAILADEHEKFLRHFAFDEAAQKHDLLLKLIDTQTNTTAMQVKELADKLGSSKKYFGAILFYEISLNLLAKHPVGEELGNDFAVCVLALTNASQNMLEYKGMTSLGSKLNITEQYVMPRIRKGIKQLKQFKSVPKFVSTMRQIDCNTAATQLLGVITKKQHEHASILFNKTVRMWEQQKAQLGQDPYKYGKYSDLLNQLGQMYETRSVLDKAVGCYTQAVESIKQAEDVSEAYQMKQLDKYNKNLQRVKKLLN